jgi:hypothetical protein
MSNLIKRRKSGYGVLWESSVGLIGSIAWLDVYMHEFDSELPRNGGV